MTRVLLLGATGFLGSHVASAIDDTPGVQCSRVGRSRIDLMSTTADELRGAIAEADAEVVVNCVGSLDGSTAELVRQQTVTTALLLDALSGSGIRLIRLGSAGEYGPIPQGTSAHEDQPTAPISAYGISHLAATLLVNAAREAGTVEGMTLRVFNPVGAGAGTTGLLPRAAQTILAAVDNGAATVQFGSLAPWRDFVDARDVAAAVVALAMAPQTSHGVYNVGSGTAVRVRSAVEYLTQVTGYAGDIVEAGEGPARSSGINWTQADTTRLTAETGWAARHTLSQALDRVVDDARARVGASPAAASRV